MKLAADNIPHLGHEHVLVVGRGATKPRIKLPSQITNKKIRQSDLATISTERCSAEANLRAILAEPASVICTLSHGNDPYTGDAGRSMIYSTLIDQL